jgi:hypothetical protein
VILQWAKVSAYSQNSKMGKQVTFSSFPSTTQHFKEQRKEVEKYAIPFRTLRFFSQGFDFIVILAALN